MQDKNLLQLNNIEPASYIWRKLFVKNHVHTGGVIIEVAPGYEPKIGKALALLGFKGTIFLIEPDQKAAFYIKEAYQRILPQATVRVVVKSLQDVEVGVDVPNGVDVLAASHPFDDMVLSFAVGQDHDSFFSQEKEDGAHLSSSVRKLYDAIGDRDYKFGIRTTIATWQRFIRSVRPNYFIASQYPSHTLMIKGLTKRQNSGFIVLRLLKNFYRRFLIQQPREPLFGFKGSPQWWIVAKRPSINSLRGFTGGLKWNQVWVGLDL